METRIFSSVSIFEPDGEERELRCPQCGCPKLVFPAEADAFTDGAEYLGKRVTCCECGHTFVVTANCWQVVLGEDRVQ